MAMEISRLLDPEVRPHPILTETYRTIPRNNPRPSTPGMVTITNIYINPAGRVSPRFHQKEHRAGYIARQLLINSRNYPVHLTQVNNESAEFTQPQPKVDAAHLLPKGLHTVQSFSDTQTPNFTTLTTGYYYPETDLCICSEPYHDQTDAPHGPSYRCEQCVTRLPLIPTASSSLRLSHTAEPAIPVTGDNQTLPSVMCSKCPTITTNMLKLDYPRAFRLPTTTAPMCHHCIMTYVCVRKEGDPDPTGLLALNRPCQCYIWLRHLMRGRVCYGCKLKECQRRTEMAERDREMHTGIISEGVGKGRLSTGYLCKCGRKILGEHHLTQKGLARCVVCERVVVGKTYRTLAPEGRWAGNGSLDEDDEDERDEDRDKNGAENGAENGGDDGDGYEIQKGVLGMGRVRIG